MEKDAARCRKHEDSSESFHDDRAECTNRGGEKDNDKNKFLFGIRSQSISQRVVLSLQDERGCIGDFGIFLDGEPRMRG